MFAFGPEKALHAQHLSALSHLLPHPRSLTHIRNNLYAPDNRFNLAKQIAWQPGQQRLKVGYFSSDFKQHPLAYLIQSLFSLHDAEKLEVFCYATTQGDGSHYRQRISRECEHFVEVSAPSLPLVQRVSCAFCLAV